MNTINVRFQKFTVWIALSKTSVFVAENAVYVLTGGANGEKISVFENIRIRVDGRCKRRKKSLFSKIFGYVWTGGANGEKNLCFRKYLDTCGRGPLKQGNHERYFVWISDAN